MVTLYLAHYGTKGQKHGVRRYQNPDGSLTPLGRAHYGVGAARTATVKAVKTVASKSGAAISKAGTAIRKKVRPTSQELDEQIAKEKERIRYNNRRKELAKMKKTGVIPEDVDSKNKKTEGSKGKFSEMTDQEINARIDRLKKEVELAKLESLKNMGPMERMVADSLGNGLAKGVGKLAESAVTKAGGVVLDGIFDDSGGKQKKDKPKQSDNKPKESNSKDTPQESRAVRRTRSAKEKKAALEAEEELRKYKREHPGTVRKVVKSVQEHYKSDKEKQSES